jgi:hypothetical protein
MDQPTLADQVRQFRVKVALEREEIARQRATIEALSKRGADTAAAQLALRALEAKERTDVAELKLLGIELAKTSGGRVGFWRGLASRAKLSK